MELRYAGEITIIFKIQFKIQYLFEGKDTKIDDVTVLSANQFFVSQRQ